MKAYNNSTGDNFVIDPAQIEIAFISATRDDSPADRSLSRGEFFEMVIRMAYLKKTLALEAQRRKGADRPSVITEKKVTIGSKEKRNKSKGLTSCGHGQKDHKDVSSDTSSFKSDASF